MHKLKFLIAHQFPDVSPGAKKQGEEPHPTASIADEQAMDVNAI